MIPNELLSLLLLSMVLLLVQSQSPQRQRVLSRAQVHTMLTTSSIQLLLLLLMLQPLFMKTRYVQFALLTPRTWPLVVVIRHAAIVAKPFNYVQYAAAKYRPESSSTEVSCPFLLYSTVKKLQILCSSMHSLCTDYPVPVFFVLLHVHKKKMVRFS